VKQHGNLCVSAPIVSQKLGTIIKIFEVKFSLAVSLLKLVRCQCKGNCDTQRCSCKRNELECSSACGECKGLCQNSNFDASTDDTSEYELLS